MPGIYGRTVADLLARYALRVMYVTFTVYQQLALLTNHTDVFMRSLSGGGA